MSSKQSTDPKVKTIRFGRIRIPHDDAVHRVVGYACWEKETAPFFTYDLAASVAREQHQLSAIGPWTILLANALGGGAGHREVKNVSERLIDFVELLRAVPVGRDLDELSDEERKAVHSFASFRAKGVRSARVTKVGALFRPRAIPILDSEIQSVYEDSSGQTIEGLASDIRSQRDILVSAKMQATERAPDVARISLLRFCDIAIWTTLDDNKNTDRPPTWLNVGREAVPRDPGIVASWLPIEEEVF